MKYQPYQEYKASEMEWLGDVPSEWAIQRLRFQVGINPTKSEIVGFAADTLVSFVPMEAVGENGGIRIDRTCPLEDVINGYTYFRNGDVVVAKITPCFENGKGSIADGLTNGVGFGTTELHVLRPGPLIDHKYLFYLTIGHAFRKIGASYMYGAGGQKRVPDDFIRDFRHSIPPLDEQKIIVAFLDRETERIDTLIEKKQRQIELLQEKRTALISHAVTKGLNPKFKMKDSGIEWLGEIPEHWEVLAVKRITSIPITDGPHETPDFLDEGIPFISAEAIKNDRIDFAKMRGFISKEEHARFSKKYRPQRGDVYLIKSGATTGNVAFVDTDDEFNIWSPLAAIRPNLKKAITPFIFFFMKSKNFFQSIELGWSYGTQQNIGMNVIENIPIALPPLDEQRTIAACLNRETTRIDALIEKVQSSIEMLREYRTALISAAVTGKIDVRQEVA